MFTWKTGELPSSKRLEKSSNDLLFKNKAHQAASPSAPLQSRGCKRQLQEEDDFTESLKTKRKNSLTQGSPADKGITISVYYLLMMIKPLYLILILQTEDMVKDQLEINLIGKKLVLRNSELL